MSSSSHTTLKIIDSHTGGEPTRLITSGVPALFGSMVERRQQVATHHDWIRTSTLLEPRGFEAMVGAILTETDNPDCVAGVIFFNNAGYLNMCIHATIGIAVTLKHMGRISEGSHKIDTPAGVVTVHLHEDESVSVENVPSYRYKSGVEVQTVNHGTVKGDISWGGNWFFLIEGYGPEVKFINKEALCHFTIDVMNSLESSGIKGSDGGRVDHIEVFGAPDNDEADSKNFVMCSGGEYDRSPCGTGTSAKLAALYDKGTLKPGQLWRQASILNTVFTGSVEPTGDGNKVIPTVSGKAWVNGETTVIINPKDPFKFGIQQ